MSDQPDPQLELEYPPNLYDGRPPAQPIDTSRAAADQITSNTGKLRAQALAWITDAGDDGLTDEQGIARSGMAANTWRPRRVELVQSGRVVDSGARRRTRSGRLAVVWKARP